MKARLLATLLAVAALGAAPAFAHGGMMETSIHDNASFAQAPAEFKVEFEHDSAITNVMLMTAGNKMIALDFKPSKAMHGQGLHDPAADACGRQLHTVLEIECWRSHVLEVAMTTPLEYRVAARRIDAHGSLASTKQAEIVLDTDTAGRPDAFNPAELLLAAIAACMIKGIERVAPMLKFSVEGVEVNLHAVRRDNPPGFDRIDYELVVDSGEADHRLELLHSNVRKFGTVSNTIAAATHLEGFIRRKGAPAI